MKTNAISVKKKIKYLIFISLAIFFIYMICQNTFTYKVAKIYFIEDFIESDKQIKILLEIDKYKEKGQADLYYKKAFTPYIFNENLYISLIAKKEYGYLPLIHKDSLKVVENWPNEINYIIEGSRKNDFSGLSFWNENYDENLGISEVNNIFDVFIAYSQAFIRIAKSHIDNKNLGDFMQTAKAFYCFLDHFQYNYPDSSIVAFAVRTKIKLLKMLSEFYCKESHFKCETILNILEKYINTSNSMLDFSESLGYLKWSDYQKFSFYGGAILLSILQISLYDIDDINSLAKIASNVNMRRYQYISMKCLSIMKCCYWRPIKAYRANKILKDLNKSNDEMTKSMVAHVRQRNLIDIFIMMYHKNKAMTK